MKDPAPQAHQVRRHGILRSLILPLFVCIAIFASTQYILSLQDEWDAVALFAGFGLYSAVLYRIIAKNDWGHLAKKHFHLPLYAFIAFAMSLIFLLQVGLFFTGVTPLAKGLGITISILACAVWAVGMLRWHRRYKWLERLRYQEYLRGK